MNFWIIVGLFAQVLFFLRFLVQWIASEQKGESVIPLTFWYLSLGGSIMLLAYSIWRGDPVFIIGQSMGSIIYVRNLFLIHRKHTPKAL